MINRHRAQALNVRIGAVLAEQLHADNFQIGLLYRRADFIQRRIQRLSAADDQNRLAVRFTHRSNLVINGIADGITRQMYFIIFQFHRLNAPNK